MQDLFTILSIAFSLFVLMDAVGNVPVFISVLKEIKPKRQRVIILRELLIALAIIIAFNFFGDLLLTLLGVSQAAVMISGGIILFLIAIKMIFPTRKDADLDVPEHKEPFIVPLAVPLIAGPAVLAAVMLYSGQATNHWIVISAIILAWAASTVILLCSTFLKKLLGVRGIIACERLMGLILTLIAVEMFLKGLKIYTTT
jgi:multiple antibiotic resistance protein